MLTLRVNDDGYDVDTTIDSSLFALFAFGVFPADQVEVKTICAPREILEWVAEHALPSSVLAEQLDPYTCTPRMVAPLTWSHTI